MRRADLSGLALLVHPRRAEASLWRRLRFEQAVDCRELLFNHYVGLARAIARRHFRRRAVARLERFDFEQLAYEGLLQAIDRYDPLRGVPFGAYARRRIAGGLADGIVKMSEVDAQVGHRRRSEQERLRSLAAADRAEDGLSALSDVAIGLALGMMLAGTGLVEAEGGVDTRPSPYESLEWREMGVRLAASVGKLPDKEAAVVRQHYVNELSFAQIAQLLDLSRGRVSQLHRSALERLRKKIRAWE